MEIARQGGHDTGPACGRVGTEATSLPLSIKNHLIGLISPKCAY